MSNNIIFTDKDKHNRALQIVDFVTGKKVPKTEHDVYLQERHTELLKEKKVDLKKPADVLLSVYKALGGGVQTQEQAEKIKKIYKSKKAFAAEEKKDEEGDIEDEDEDEDEDDE